MLVTRIPGHPQMDVSALVLCWEGDTDPARRTFVGPDVCPGRLLQPGQPLGGLRVFSIRICESLALGSLGTVPGSGC